MDTETAAEPNSSTHLALPLQEIESQQLRLHPLLVDTVLHCVFRYEPLEVLKECRLVCQKWKLICDPFFIRRAMFVLADDEKDPKKTPREIPTAKFEALFESIDKDVLFTAFKFQFNLLTPPVREKYFEPNKLLMTQLVIHNSLSMEEDMKNCSVDPLIGPNLNQLKLSSSYKHKIQMENLLSVSLDKLTTISFLDLHRCTIVLNTKKMVPKQLKLSAFHVERNGRIAQFIPINEMLDFCRLQKLHLKGFTECGLGSAYVRYSLNFSDCANIKDLSLVFIKVNLDGKISPKKLSLDRCVYSKGGVELKQFILNDFLSSTHFCEINLSGMFCLVKVDFENEISIDRLKTSYSQIEPSRGVSNRIKIRDLEIEEIQVFSVSIIPPTVERLKIVFVIYGNMTISNNNLLPNLKQLMLFEGVSALSHFINCNALVDVALSPALRETLTVNDMPPNIKRLLLLHNVALGGEKVFKIDVLALSGCHSSFTKFDLLQLYSKLQPATVVFCNYGHYNSTLNNICEKSIEIILNLKRKLPPDTQVAFGPVKWESEQTFQNSSLSKVVQKMAKYYILDRVSGKAIDKTTFSDMIPFV